VDDLGDDLGVSLVMRMERRKLGMGRSSYRPYYASVHTTDSGHFGCSFIERASAADAHICFFRGIA